MCYDQPDISLTARLRAKDVAKLLDMPKRTVLQHIAEGKLKAHIVGNSYRIFGRDVIAYFRSI